MSGQFQPNRSGVSGVLCIFIAFLLIPGFGFAQQSQRDKVDNFAKCITKKNAVMYGNFLCSHCDDQRKLFGESFKYIHYVECSRIASPQDTNACNNAQIRYTPTWVLDGGEHLVGLQTFKELSDKTGCPLP